MFTPTAAHSAARLALSKKRPMTSLMEKEIVAEGPDMIFYKADWVPLYYDVNHKVASSCGRIQAFRACTLKGDFLWMVFTPEKSKGYHASCECPFDAIDAAKDSWARRRAVRQQWDVVEQTSRDLLTGRQKFDVTQEDLTASPLCALGIEGFRNLLGLRSVTRLPGWVMALLMKVEPQVGFIIYEAAKRQEHTASQAQSAQVSALTATPAQ